MPPTASIPVAGDRQRPRRRRSDTSRAARRSVASSVGVERRGQHRVRRRPSVSGETRNVSRGVNVRSARRAASRPRRAAHAEPDAQPRRRPSPSRARPRCRAGACSVSLDLGAAIRRRADAGDRGGTAAASAASERVGRGGVHVERVDRDRRRRLADRRVDHEDQRRAVDARDRAVRRRVRMAEGVRQRVEARSRARDVGRVALRDQREVARSTRAAG